MGTTGSGRTQPGFVQGCLQLGYWTALCWGDSGNVGGG